MFNENNATFLKLGQSTGQSGKVTVLAVGDPDEWLRQGHMLPHEKMAFLAFEDISEESLRHFSPSVIFSPVLANGFDCIELTLLLRNLAFEGAYRAVAQDLPKPALIEREVSQLYPDLDFKIEIQADLELIETHR